MQNKEWKCDDRVQKNARKTDLSLVPELHASTLLAVSIPDLDTNSPADAPVEPFLLKYKLPNN
jgi:hypothetical protein